jgi:predicted nucleic acid-binding protein
VNLVVDASVAIKWFVEEPLYEEADRLLGEASTLSAPDLFIPEVTNIAWKKAMRGEIGRVQARNVPVELQLLRIDLHASLSLVARALDVALTLEHLVYDCFYLACAEVIDAPLVTADDRLHQRVRNTEFAARVRHLSRWDAAP